MQTDPGTFVDLDRYPVHDLLDHRTVALADECRTALHATGVATIVDFIRPVTVSVVVADALRCAPDAHRQDVFGSPYLERPAEHWPPEHPRRAEGRSALTAIPYDDLAQDSPLRALYEWNGLLDFIAHILEVPALYRYDDDLGAVNVAMMRAGDELAWHFDQTDFVVSIALQSSESGGDFECVPMLRAPDDERYVDVAATIAGDRADRTTTVPMTPGTLVFFAGRHSLHRVTVVGGETPRHVALLGYDTKPGTCSSDLLRRVRYGRTSARRPPSVDTP